MFQRLSRISIEAINNAENELKPLKCSIYLSYKFFQKNLFYILFCGFTRMHAWCHIEFLVVYLQSVKQRWSILFQDSLIDMESFHEGETDEDNTPLLMSASEDYSSELKQVSTTMHYSQLLYYVFFGFDF